MVRIILSNNVGLPLLFLLSAFCNIFTVPTMVAQSQSPQITSFSPKSARQGDTVTIQGTNFTSVFFVKFGGINATSFTQISSTVIKAVVGAGSSGDVSVLTPGGTATQCGFSFFSTPGSSLLPTIESFSPSSAKTGDTVTIQATGTPLITGVTFGGVPAASFILGSPLKAVVGAGASGNVALLSALGTASRCGFTFIPAPTITSFSPTCANTGDTVSISGTFLTNPAYVLFGGVPATAIIPVSSTLVRAVVGAGASGNVQVSTVNGTATKSGFTFSFPPTITSFSPTSARTGDTVNISGTFPNGATTVMFGSATFPATAVIPVSSTLIKAVVGAGGSGDIFVATTCGTAAKSGFLFISPPLLLPILTDFSPSVRHGDTLSIHGQQLSNTTTVSLAGIPQQQILNISDSLIKVIVVSAADRRGRFQGAVCITTIVGTVCTAGGSFGITCPPATCISVCPPLPIITRLTPTDVNLGDTLFIKGTELLGVSRISSEIVFSPNSPSASSLLIPMPSFQIISDSLIKAVVTNGISGELIVDNDCSFRTPAAKITMLTPYIHSISKFFAGRGDTVKIIGDFFGGPTSVSFGGKEAASFSFVVDPTASEPRSFGTITAIVGKGASGDVAVSTRTGTRKISGFTFLSTFTAKAPNNRDEQSLLKKSATPSEESLTVYPNPATNSITLETLLESESTAEVILSDILGKRLWSSHESLQGGKLSTQIDMSQYTAGIYRIEVIHANGQHRIARVLKR